VQLIITVQLSGAQRLFHHPVQFFLEVKNKTAQLQCKLPRVGVVWVTVRLLIRGSRIKIWAQRKDIWI